MRVGRPRDGKAAVFGCVLGACAALNVLKVSALGLLVPAYFGPGGPWAPLNDAAERVPLVAIMNPANGPGKAAGSGYSSVIDSLHRSHGKVIGYIYSSYAARPWDELRADIDRYYAFYAVDGIFIDEMTNDSSAEHLAYYETIYGYVKTKNAAHLVIGNPGSKAPAAYVTRPVVDTLVTFENAKGYEGYVPDLWTKTQSPAALAHLCYAVTNAQTMTNDVKLAVSRNTGYLYVTDDGGNNPWDRLPTYWAEEVAFIETINREGASQRRAQMQIELAEPASVRVAVTGAPGRFVLEGSSDLSVWTREATNLSANGSLSFLLPRESGPAPGADFGGQTAVQVFRMAQ